MRTSVGAFKVIGVLIWFSIVYEKTPPVIRQINAKIRRRFNIFMRKPWFS
jgi:hypothetical protein